MELLDWLGPDDREPASHELTKSWTPFGMWWLLPITSERNPEHYTFKFGEIILKGSLDGELTIAIGDELQLGTIHGS